MQILIGITIVLASNGVRTCEQRKEKIPLLVMPELVSVLGSKIQVAFLNVGPKNNLSTNFCHSDRLEEQGDTLDNFLNRIALESIEEIAREEIKFIEPRFVNYQ